MDSEWDCSGNNKGTGWNYGDTLGRGAEKDAGAGGAQEMDARWMRVDREERQLLINQILFYMVNVSFKAYTRLDFFRSFLSSESMSGLG